MSTIVTRTGKGSSLTYAEADANFTNLNTDKIEASTIHAATSKATPVDNDELPIIDSAASNVLKKLTWVNLKATLKTYFDTLYAKVGLSTASGLTLSTSKLLGRTTAGTGAIEEISVGTGLTFSAGSLSVTNSGAVGQCILTTPSTSSLKLSPLNGNLLTINGVNCSIPDAGVTLASAPAAANTNYYIYAVATAGVVTSLEASTTVYTLSTTTGNKGTPIKTGDDTRTLVGFARGNNSTQWVDTATQRFLENYWNPKPRVAGVTVTSGGVQSSNSTWVAATGMLIEWISLKDSVVVNTSGSTTIASGTCTTYAGVAIDGAVTPEAGYGGSTVSAVNTTVPVGATIGKTGLSAGYHSASLLFFINVSSNWTPTTLALSAIIP